MNLSLSLFYKIFDKKYRGLCNFIVLGINSMIFLIVQQMSGRSATARPI